MKPGAPKGKTETGGPGVQSKSLPPTRKTVSTGIMDGVDPDSVNPARGMIQLLHHLMKAIALHDPKHSLARKAAAALSEAVVAAHPPFVLQFVAGGVFLDRTLVPLDFQLYERCQDLTRALARLGAHELSFETALSEDAALRLGRALAAGSRGMRDDLKGVDIAGLSWREIPFAQSGIDAEGVDPEVAGIAHTVLGLSVAEQIDEQPNAPWPWHMGFAVVRRLEKGLAASPDAAMQVMEFAPEGWPVPRRAVSASLLVLQVLTRVGVDEGNRRAAAHATLALGLAGMEPRGGLDIHAAADQLRRRILQAPIQAEAGVAPQCLLVATLVHMLGSEARRKQLASPIVTGLIELAYDMERARCPERVPFDLTRADLLAYAVGQAAGRFSDDWVRAVIKICGTVPVGACVQLADGRVGIVIEPGPPDYPFCPVVHVDGQRVFTDQPVMLVPPTRLRRVQN